MSVAGERKNLAVVMIAVEPCWLALSREERREKRRQAEAAIAHHPEVEVAWFDGDGLSGRYSDFVTCRFGNLRSYQFLWEELRDLDLFGKPYMRIVEVILGASESYRDYEATLA